jgi:hypothetical protein
MDALLALLAGDNRDIPARMRAAGYEEQQLLDAWDEARRLGFTESTGLGQDRLTEEGRARANELR